MDRTTTANYNDDDELRLLLNSTPERVSMSASVNNDDNQLLFNYEVLDTDKTSRCFQGLSACYGRMAICCCVPWVLCCGCSGPTQTIREGQRGILLRFGKLVKLLSPGTYTFNPASEEILIASIQVKSITLKEQTVITKDGINVKVDAVCFIRIIDVPKALLGVTRYLDAVSNLSQYSLETVLGEYYLEDLLQHRDQVTQRIEEIIKKNTLQWGVKMEALELRDIQIPHELVRVMAAEAEATREGKAKIITAKAELEAAEAYAEASAKLKKSEGSMQLRYFQTLTEIASEKNSTILLPSYLGKLFE